MATWKKYAIIASGAVLFLFVISRQFQAQIQSNASYLRQAAQEYSNAAAKCQNPAGAACLRRFAAYENCVAGGGRCTQPTCSTSCLTGGSSSTNLSPLLTTGALNTSQTAAETQQVEQGILLGVQLYSMFHHAHASQSAPPAESAAQLQQQQQEEQQQQEQADAASLLARSNQLMASLNTNAPPAPPAQSDATSTVSSLLDNGAPSDSSTAEVSSLLDNGPPSDSSTSDVASQQGESGSSNAAGSPADSGSSATSTVSNLLGGPAAPDGNSNSGADNTAIPAQASAFSSPFPSSLTPTDPQMDNALQDSTDQPDDTETSSLGQMFQSGEQQIKDGLNNLVTSAKTLASNVMNDPIVNWAVSDKGSLTTLPLPDAGDSPETAADKVSGQSVAGFGSFMKGPWEGLDEYGTKMVDQMGADLGLANDTVFGTDGGTSN